MSLTLYSRSGCHLCEEMERELAAHALPFRRVEINGDAELERRYGHKVPVLCGDGDEEICHYFLDEDALGRWRNGEI